jgi:hypothetical protein
MGKDAERLNAFARHGRRVSGRSVVAQSGQPVSPIEALYVHSTSTMS